MKNRLWLILCIVWIGIVSAIFAYKVCIEEDDLNITDDSWSTGDGFLIAHTCENESMVLDMNTESYVRKLFMLDEYISDCKAIQVVEQDGIAYALITDRKYDDTSDRAVYKILELSDYGARFEVRNATGWFSTYERGTITDLTADSSALFLTQISEDGTQAFIYPILYNSFTKENAVVDEKIRLVDTIKYSDSYKAVSEQIYFASYKGGTMVAIEDPNAELPDGVYNEKAAESFNDMMINLRNVIRMEHKTFINCLVLMLIGCVLIISIFIMIYRRNRVAYLILVWEAMVGAFVIAGYFFLKPVRFAGAKGVILFFIFSALGIVALLMQNLDLQLFVGAMRKLAAGRTDIWRPKTLGDDMTDLWNGLADVSRAIQNINYSKFKLFEGYYSFAPKGLERLLQKDSITEVLPGDMVHNTGTLAMIYMEKQRELYGFSEKGVGLLSAVLDNVAKVQEAGEGTMIGRQYDLSNIALMLDENSRRVTEFGITLNSLDVKTRIPVFMHYGRFDGMVLGNDNQKVMTFSSEDFKVIEKNLLMLGELGIGCVITKDVYDREEKKPLCRYIGKLNGSEDIDMYEVLDGLPISEQKLKRETDETFQNGLMLIKKRDYYLARNEFAKVLRINPADNIARKCLFICEERLK